MDHQAHMDGGEESADTGISRDEERQYVSYWWETTGDTPEICDYQKQVIADEHDLFPFDPYRERRNSRSGKNACMRTKEDARLVQNAHIYKATEHTVAMTIPADWSFEFKPRVGPLDMTSQADAGQDDQSAAQFGATITELVKEHLKEAKGKSVLEDWVRDSSTFRAGIVKVWHQSEYLTDPLSKTRLCDKQDEIAELRSLKADYAAGRFTKSDGRYVRMRSMELGLASEAGQLEFWSGICMETVSLRNFRIDPRITSPDAFHSAKWMAEDLVMSKRDLLARFPYEEDDSERGFSGIKEDDLGAAGYAGSGDTSGDLVEEELQRRQTTGNHYNDVTGSNGGQAGANTADDNALFLVRQVWIRDENKVLVLVNGLDYPAGEWAPEVTPSHWYPFHLLVLSRQPRKWFGRSFTELASDEQARINQADTDDEKARDLSFGRWVYDTGSLDGQEPQKVRDIPSGGMRGIDLQGKHPADLFFNLAQPYDPRLTDSARQGQRMDKMVGTPSSALGQMQTAQFATELDLAARGTDIMTAQRQATVRRGLEDVLRAIAEMLLQVVDEEEAKLYVGKNAYLPRFYRDNEAAAAKMTVQAAVISQVDAMMQSAEALADEGISQEEIFEAYPGLDNPRALSRELYQIIALDRWGALEPMTRESMFKRLRLDVDTTPDARMQARQAVADITQVAQLLQMSGRRLSTKALGKILADLLDIKDQVDDLMEIDPAAAVAELMAAISENGLDALGPEGIQQLASLGLIAQQAMMQMEAERGRMQAEAAAQQAIEEDQEAEEIGLMGLEGDAATEGAPSGQQSLAG